MANTERDFILGRNIPRPTNIISGGQWADSQVADIRGKRPTFGPPMQIGVSSPYMCADSDEEWIQTYGGSLDNTFAIINGQFIQQSIDAIELQGVYQEGTVNIKNDNIWLMANDAQQVQYVVSQNTAIGGAISTAWAGAVNELRGFGMRVPVLAGGWGRTIDGRPTDPQPDNKRKNDEEHKLARETWKYGPIELRWDYRKNTWSAYNELVTDHQDQGMGTWVFSTNPDSQQGFPFLRGKLEDVWWVRHTKDFDNTDGHVEAEQTAEVLTHLEHKFFDKDENGAGKLKSVFIIPHDNGTDDNTHKKGDEGVLGDETTGVSLEDRIDIRTTVHFWKKAGQDGPIKFGAKASEVDVCCKPTDGKYIVGEMLFIDEVLSFCPSNSAAFGGPVIAQNAGKVPYEWVPAIKIDECALMGKQMLALVTNDVNLGVRISDFCNDISTWTTDAAKTIDANFGQVDKVIRCINDEMANVATSATRLVAEANLNALNRDNVIIQLVNTNFGLFNAAITNFVNTLNASLIKCLCDPISSDKIPFLFNINNSAAGPLIAGHGNGGILVNKCKFVYDAFADFPCDNCYGTHISMPCMTQNDVVAGAPCGGSNAAATIALKNPTTCGAH